MQVGKRRFCVFDRFGRVARQARHAALGRIGGDLHILASSLLDEQLPLIEGAIRIKVLLDNYDSALSNDSRCQVFHLLFEATARFGLLQPPAAGALLVAFLAAGWSVALRRGLAIVASVVSLATLVTALALLQQARDLAAFAAPLFVLAGIAEAAGLRGLWPGLRWPAALGVDLTAWIVAELVARPGGMPESWTPLRAEADRQAVLAAIADGTIDVIASGHDPRGPEDKRLPFADAEPGMAGAETLLPLTLGIVRDGVIDMARAFAMLTANPAKLLGVEAGALAAGLEADIAIIDPERPWIVDSDKMAASAGNTPFDKQPVQGRVVALFKGGAEI